MNYQVKNKILIGFLLAIAVIRLLLIYYTPLDSDEVMWTVMAERTIKQGEHFLFFTDQNFRGSLEAYILLPFLYIFGLNEFVLRINSIIFIALSGLMVYKITKHITKRIDFSILSVILFLLPLPQILFIYNKAWGGYVTIQFLMLLSYYLLETKILANTQKKYNIYIPILGLIGGLSFWINEQSIYFVFVIIFAGLFYDVRNKFLEYKFFDKSLYLFFSFFSFLILFFIIKKKMFINLNTSLSTKIGISSSSLGYNIYLQDLILGIIALFLIFVLAGLLFKKFNFIHSLFLNFSIFSFAILYVNVVSNSFSRIYNPNPSDLVKTSGFLNEIILNNIFGNFKYVYLALTLLGLYFCFKNAQINKFRTFAITDLVIVSIISFPIMFLLSALPGLTPTPRYLILLWPLSVVMVFIVFNNLIKVSIKFSNILYAFLIIWLVNLFFLKSNFEESINLKISQDQSFSKIVKNIENLGFKRCVGNYWAVGLVYFYSDLDIKCYTSKVYGVEYKFLDFYKDTSDNKVYIVY